jgi:hypothetical protein
MKHSGRAGANRTIRTSGSLRPKVYLTVQAAESLEIGQVVEAEGPHGREFETSDWLLSQFNEC